MEISATLSRKQLERALSQRIQAFYLNQLGHQPSETTCQLFDKHLAVALKSAVTQPEHLLVESGQQELAKQLRASLDRIIQPRLKALIEELLQIAVVDLIIATQMETDRLSVVVVLAEQPKTNGISSKRAEGEPTEESADGS